ncbi:aldolase/citrate lyase family protein [Acuticoccus sp. M5D2P5]|uniref:HpcH/HpaI aldolase family protein n=1 Tax=Acuticoccus kalidii TaxID=2910977 RepID=UPI001F397FB7|nr:aldolase/citrate lyase family protein [Acuticoccus kalidii]MCF3932680.1 aldolase/citrate lyase family protein [Acuticoccus kalidii]
MSGSDMRATLKAGGQIKMINPHDSSYSLATRLIGHGADAVFLDCEHGSWSFEDVRVTSGAVQLAGGNAIVRPRCHDRSLIIRYLNCGAQGIMVPMVDSAEEAQAIVDAVRYAYPHEAENDGGRLIVCMIESAEAVKNDLDALLDVDGVDVFFFGPTDLTQSMGLMPPKPGEDWNERTKALIHEALAKVTARGRIGGTLVREDNAREYAEAGAQFFYLHADPFLRAGFDRFNSALAG